MRGRGGWLAAICLTAICPLGAADVAAQDAPVPLQPYAVNHELRVASDADVRFLHDGPAGSHGFIQVRDGHLYRADGKRFRCWGVNITGFSTGSAEIPAGDDARQTAAFLAQIGVNCVRMHFLDMPVTQGPRERSGGADPTPAKSSPSGLIADGPTSRVLDPAALDRLDHWFAELKKNGIYVNFNLNVGRTYRAGDNVPDAELIGIAKAYTYFGPELIALQKEYARQLLDHRNRVTGLRYADDPAVVTVEVVNENSLLEFWMRNWLRGERVPGGRNTQLDMTPHYQALLVGLYNDWLAKNRKPAEVAQLRMLAGVAAGQPVPFMRRGDHPDAPRLRLDAELAFLTQVEIDFHAEMKRYLKDEVGVKSPIIPMADHTYFIANQPLMRTAIRSDIMDAHVYWQHPSIYGKRNEPMVNSPELSIIQKLARSAVAGKPLTVSEVNHPWPSGDYGAEMIPILASYAALQDWDGIYFYTYEPKVRGKWTPLVTGEFDIALDPAKIAQMPAGAMIFLRGDVSAAKETLTRSYSTDQINEASRLPRAEMPYYTPGFDTMIPLVHGSRVACLDCKPSLPAPLPTANPIVSDTGELSWKTSEGKDGLVSIDTPRSQALVGFVNANPKVQTRNLAADIKNAFAAITLSSLDGKPLNLSDKMLLTTTGKVENTGQLWNDRRAMLSNWGTAPTLIEPITGWLQLKDLEGAIGVTAQALDGSARPIGPEIRGKMIEPGWEIAVGAPAATTYLIRVER